jgi:hypothetical protein
MVFVSAREDNSALARHVATLEQSQMVERFAPIREF